LCFQTVAYREGEGEQVDGGEGLGQALLVMTEVVFERVAVVFQHVEAFILDLPARSGASGDLSHRVPGHWQMVAKASL